MAAPPRRRLQQPQKSTVISVGSVHRACCFTFHLSASIFLPHNPTYFRFDTPRGSPHHRAMKPILLFTAFVLMHSHLLAGSLDQIPLKDIDGKETSLKAYKG